MAKDGNKQRFNAIARQSASHQNTMSFQRHQGAPSSKNGRGGFKNKGGNSQNRNNSGGKNFKKYREQKLIKFDRNKRIEFVTGFKKRKDERRFKAKLRAKEEQRQERAELVKTKAQQRQSIEEQYEQIRQMKKAEMGINDDDEESSESDSDAEAADDKEKEGENKVTTVEDEFDGGMFEKE